MGGQVNVNDWIDYLLEDANGVHTYSQDRAQFGYVEAYKYLQLPNGLRHAQPPNTNLTTVGNTAGSSQVLGSNGTQYRTTNTYIPRITLSHLDTLKIVCLNYDSLHLGGLEVQTAYLCAQLRLRWLYLGCLYASVADRRTTHDEVNWVLDTDTRYGGVVKATTLKELMNEDVVKGFFRDTQQYVLHDIFGKEFVSKWAETIWCTSELVFRIRGHHFKNEYIPLLTRVVTASTESALNLPPTFPFEHVFRTAIHPFGIRALPTMAYHFMAHGRVGNSLYIRFNGAPNGTACFTTLAAGLRLLASEPWYSDFERGYSEQIRLANLFAERVLNDKYGYHMSANLYGVQKQTTFIDGQKTYTISEAENTVGTLAAYVVGYANAVNDAALNNNLPGLAFADQKALIKRVTGNPILAMRTMTLVEVSLRILGEAKTTGEVVKHIVVAGPSSNSNALVVANQPAGNP